MLPQKGRDQDQPAKKSCDYVITRKRQIELNGITSMHQVYGKRIFKCELTCLRYLRIFKEQARKEDEEQKSASQEKRKRRQKRLKRYPLKPSELSLNERKKWLRQLKVYEYLNPSENDWFPRSSSASRKSNLVGRKDLSEKSR